MYPEDCVQSILGSSTPWWIPNKDGSLCRGAVITAFAPHVDQVPYMFEPIGRNNPEQHKDAIVRVTPLQVNQPLRQAPLPVAALPLHRNEVWAAYRAKRRPCLVVGSLSPEVDQKLTRGMPKNSTAPTILVAPYYGVDRDGSRAGYNKDFVERVRHCEYPQFIWDRLPNTSSGGPKESILRLDQIQPIGTHYMSHKISEFRLSDDALGIIDELFQWLIWGGVEEESLIALYRQTIESTFGQTR